MKNKGTIFITGLAGILLIFVGLFVYLNFFFGKYIKETVLEKNIVISFDWKEINTQNLVKIEKDNHYVSILLEPPFEADTQKKGIKSPSGEISTAEMKLIDEDGKEYSLAFVGSRRDRTNEYANYGYNMDLPTNKKYEKLLIRSDVPIKTQEILWSGYNTRDLK